MGIQPFDKDVEIIQKLDDEPNDVTGLSPAELKLRFDQAAIWLKEYINNTLIPAISGILPGGTTGADNISAAVDDFPGTTVQSVLNAFNDALVDRYTKGETQSYVGEETNDLVASVSVDLATGVITVSKKDGSKQTFDTPLEKVPATMDLVEEGDSVYLVITNQDGSKTQTDVSKLIDQYAFNDSAELDFTTGKSGSSVTVTASLRPNSIGLDRFKTEVTSELEQYNATSKANSDQALKYAEQSEAMRDEASEFAQTAESKAGEAATKAMESSYHATQASVSASSASYSSTQAQTSATQSAESASKSELYSNQSAESAINSKSWAVGGTGSRDGEDYDNSKYWGILGSSCAGISATASRLWAEGEIPEYKYNPVYDIAYGPDVFSEEPELFPGARYEINLQKRINSGPTQNLGISYVVFNGISIEIDGLKILNNSTAPGVDGISMEGILYRSTIQNTSYSVSMKRMKSVLSDGTSAKEWADKAKDYAEQAGAGGVTSFNGRTGLVVPESGDYTAEMVGAASLNDQGVVPAEQMPGYTRSSGGDEMGIACVGGPLKLDKIRGNTVLGGTPTYDAPVSMTSVESPLCLNVAGKNLIDLSRAAAQTSFGVTSMIDSAAGTITLSGTCSRPGNSAFLMLNKENPIWLPAGAYFLSGLQSDYESTSLRLYINCHKNSDLEQNIGTYGTTTMAGTAFTLSSGAWIVLAIRVPDGMDTTGIVICPQIEAGAGKTAFEPYQGEFVEIPLIGADGQELEPLRMAYGGNSSTKTAYYDRIVRRNGVWCIERSVAERALTDAVWVTGSSYAVPYFGGSGLKDGATSYLPFCTHFPPRAGSAAGQDTGVWVGTMLAVGNQALPNGASTTAEELKAFCTAQAEVGTPVTAVYALKTPIYEELHQDIQVLLNTLSVPGGVCSVWFEGDILPSGADIGFPRGDYPSATAVSACRLVGLHIADTNNPHNVTAEQVGADPAGSAAAVQQALSAHMEDKDNPHAVAAAQILFADGESLQHKQENGTLSPGGIRLGTAAISMPLNPANEAYRCIAYGGGKYVALSPYFAAVSETGVDWQMVETSLTDQPNAAAYGDGRFIAVCENGAIYKSEDGLTWAPIQTQNQVPLADVVFHGGKWVAVGIGAILFSSDGDHWSEVHSGANLYAVTCGNGRFLTVGDWTMLYSDDGQSWTAQDMGLETFDRCVYGNGTFVIATGNRVLYSQDGTSWYDTEGSFDSLTGLEFGGGVFVAASAASAYRSTDGIHWAPAEASSGWTAAVYGHGRFLAISENEKTLLLSSIDGATWEESIQILVDENGNDVTKAVATILGI